jgi:hypothetical protein
MFREGDLVHLLQKHVRRDISKKHSSPWIGPYTVVEITGVHCVLRSGTKRRACKVHSNRLKFDMRLEALLVLSVTRVAVDFTVENYEDTPGL